MLFTSASSVVPHVHLVTLCVKLGMTPQVASDSKSCEELALNGVDRVLDDAEDIKAGGDGLGEFHVLLERHSRVVSPPDRIRCGDDGTASLERGDDAGLGYRDGLLLHGLVY